MGEDKFCGSAFALFDVNADDDDWAWILRSSLNNHPIDQESPLGKIRLDITKSRNEAEGVG
jgi:hypothetical protein